MIVILKMKIYIHVKYVDTIFRLFRLEFYLEFISILVIIYLTNARGVKAKYV